MPYLHTIGLENFRLFKDRTTFELAPITILTGINNSGKSSLIKSLQLFKSSIKATGGLDELNFTGGRHNLGSFKTALNRNSESGEMKFRFDFPLQNIREKTFLELIYKAEEASPEFGELIEFSVAFDNGQFLLRGELDPKDQLGKLLFFDFEFLNEYFSKIYCLKYFEEKSELKRQFSDPEYVKDLFDSIKMDSYGESIQEFHDQTIFDQFYSQNVNPFLFPYKDDGCYQIFKGFEDFSELGKNQSLNMLYRLKHEGFSVSRSHSEFDFFSYLEESLRLIKVNLEWIDDANSKKPKFELSSIMEYILEDFLKNDILERLKRFESGFQSISSLSSVRANSERLYSNDSDIVDINSLLIDFSRITFKMNDPIEDFVDRSLQLFSIGEKINIKRHQGKATEVYAKRDGEDVLLADLGFGFTQLVPIILKIAVAAYRKQTEQSEVPFLSSLFLLEEPESNLHPSYQSKLAELIFDAARTFDIQFIIETHSEYMIRNFQYLTATKQIPSNGTKIYYLNQPDSEDFKEAPYREIKIMSDGRLSNEFGSGFFDEADKIVFELYRLSVNNN